MLPQESPAARDVPFSRARAACAAESTTVIVRTISERLLNIRQFMEPNLEAEIVAREDALLRAITTNDVALLDDLLHDDLLFNGPDGQTGTKAQDLANYRSGGIQLRRAEASDRLVRVIGGDAVVAVTVTLEGTYLGTRVDGRYRYLRVWQRAGDAWRIIGGSVVPL
jgi:hypothetical protein